MALVDIELRSTPTLRLGITYDDQASRRYVTQLWAELDTADAITVVAWTTADSPNPGRTASVTLVGPGRKTFAVPTGAAARIGATYDPQTGKLAGVDFETRGA